MNAVVHRGQDPVQILPELTNFFGLKLRQHLRVDLAYDCRNRAGDNRPFSVSSKLMMRRSSCERVRDTMRLASKRSSARVMPLELRIQMRERSDAVLDPFLASCSTKPHCASVSEMAFIR
ncbi:hypothetical protein [Pseudomonas sp. 273]|uniref:hypothetical protein n=1 Tax=Pseudomonas sp. 273 TaxID=75692 RepID=UPI0023D7E310|nr:hypothetical protein [Pseudomonas sp. 273]